MGRILSEAAGCLKRGENQKALDLLTEAVLQAPDQLELRHGLGEVQALSGRLEEAIQNLRMVVEAAPGNARFQLSLAEALKTGKSPEAVTHFLAAIECGAQEDYAYWHLVALLMEQQRFEKAIGVCDMGLKLNPADVLLLRSRAVTFSFLGRHETAIEGVIHACERDPKNPEIWRLLGNLLRDAGKLAEAERSGRQACALDPKLADSHVDLAMTLLLGGKYREGFREYEWRRELSGAPSLKNAQWDGSELKGKRILLWAEQGAGDAIQFARYVERVKQTGAEVMLGVSHALTRLMSWMPGPLSVVASLVHSEERAAFDVQCPLMTLPLIFGTDLHTIPAPATFAIPEERKQEWRKRLVCEQRLKVGLVWAGNRAHKNDSNRSIEFARLKRLLRLPACRFFSLQVGGNVAEADETIDDLSPLLVDFAETAAAISQLDLMITVDTSVAHLAGSVGIPTWVLLPFSPDWRWMLSREDSPWYQSARLFRQKKARDWEEVIDAVERELLERAGL